jgi:hypothetical protein
VAPFRTGLEVSEWIDGRMLCKASVALSETYNTAVERRVRIASRSGAAQPGHSPGADVGHPRLLRGDLGSPRDQELADLGTVVHTVDGTPDRASAGMPYRYTSR